MLWNLKKLICFVGLAASTSVSIASESYGEVLNIIAMGQSNMTGITGTNTFWLIEHPEPLTRTYNTDATELDKALLCWYGGLPMAAYPQPTNGTNYWHLQRAKISNGRFFGPDAYLLWTLKNTNTYTVVTKSTLSETVLDLFLPGQSGWAILTNAYATTLAEAEVPNSFAATEPFPASALLEIDPSRTTDAIDIMIFGQGESGHITSNPGTYWDKMTNYISAVKAEFNSPNMKVIFMGMNHYYDAYPDHPAHDSDAAFKRYVSENPEHSVYVYTKDLSVRSDYAELSGEDPTNVHYSQWGLRDLGIRLAGVINGLYNIDHGIEFSVSGNQQIVDDAFLFQIEINANPGQTYYISYKDSLLDEWVSAYPPTIVVPIEGAKWVDSGPPVTESAPESVPSRFYRIIEADQL